MWVNQIVACNDFGFNEDHRIAIWRVKFPLKASKTAECCWIKVHLKLELCHTECTVE